MSTYNAADIRKMIDKLDIQYRRAIIKGDVEIVFKTNAQNWWVIIPIDTIDSHAYTQDKIIAIKCEKKTQNYSTNSPNHNSSGGLPLDGCKRRRPVTWKFFGPRWGTLWKHMTMSFLPANICQQLFKTHSCSRPLIHLARKTNQTREIHLPAKDRPTRRHSFHWPLMFPPARLQFHRPASHWQPPSHQLHQPVSHQPPPNDNFLLCHQIYYVVHCLPTSHHQIRWFHRWNQVPKLATGSLGSHHPSLLRQLGICEQKTSMIS